MYILKTEGSFDSAHFLAGYDGKCRNIHGHRWRVVAEIFGENLAQEGQTRDMVCDFSDFKKDLKAILDEYDHSLIIERGELRPATLKALKEENFRIIELKYRPTAERLAEHFGRLLQDKGYSLKACSVYETPENCAIYIPEP